MNRLRETAVPPPGLAPRSLPHHINTHHKQRDFVAEKEALELPRRRAPTPPAGKAFEHLYADDTPVIWKVDCLSKSLQHLIEMVTSLDERNQNMKDSPPREPRDQSPISLRS